MKNHLIKMIIMALLCAGLLIPYSCFAETGMVSIATKTSMEVGDTLTVTVKYAASSIGLIDGVLRYDPTKLQFVSAGTAKLQSAGMLKLYKEPKGAPVQLFTIHFKAIGPGSSYCLVNTSQYVDGQQKDLGKPGASVRLAISKVATEPVVKDPVVTPADPVVDPVTKPSSETPTPVETPVSNTQNEKAPDTLWVYVGAIVITSVLLVLALIIVNRKRDSDK
jgi:hypothetical protein